jgi:hypothetical protein
MTDVTQANRELAAILLPVNNELGDHIVRAWLKLHIAWAQDSYDHAVLEEDKVNALADLHAMSQVLNYAGGELDD